MNHTLNFEFHKTGVVDHVASDRRIYIDVDRHACPKLAPIFSLCRIVGVQPLWTQIRRTAHGWHIIIELRDRLLPSESIAFQALAGSDSRREALNLMRVLAIRRTPIKDPFWRKRWNILYAHKVK